IVDDHPIVQESIKNLLAREFPGTAVDTTADGNLAIKIIWDRPYDIIILGISIPGRNGLFVLKKIKELHPETSVIVLSILPEELFGPRVIKAGAAAYVQKTQPEAELLKALKAVFEGGRYISHSLAEKIIFEMGVPGKRPAHDRLSDEEFHILRLLAEGRTSRNIAEEMCLSENMVRKLRSRIKKSLDLKTTSELIRYAIQEKIIA
ncbi:MAG: response regulator transcription factor, partial [Candidatus Aminicenantes bacterium]|nr:response regulator transcription factor [Candidatus Aminicenantes bacterium]